VVAWGGNPNFFFFIYLFGLKYTGIPNISFLCCLEVLLLVLTLLRLGGLGFSTQLQTVTILEILPKEVGVKLFLNQHDKCCIPYASQWTRTTFGLNKIYRSWDIYFWKKYSFTYAEPPKRKPGIGGKSNDDVFCIFIRFGQFSAL
jgi:hypothetical protein